MGTPRIDTKMGTFFLRLTPTSEVAAEVAASETSKLELSPFSYAENLPVESPCRSMSSAPMASAMLRNRFGMGWLVALM